MRANFHDWLQNTDFLMALGDDVTKALQHIHSAKPTSFLK